MRGGRASGAGVRRRVARDHDALERRLGRFGRCRVGVLLRCSRKERHASSMVSAAPLACALAAFLRRGRGPCVVHVAHDACLASARAPWRQARERTRQFVFWAVSHDYSCSRSCARVPRRTSRACVAQRPRRGKRSTRRADASCRLQQRCAAAHAAAAAAKHPRHTAAADAQPAGGAASGRAPRRPSQQKRCAQHQEGTRVTPGWSYNEDRCVVRRAFKHARRLGAFVRHPRLALVERARRVWRPAQPRGACCVLPRRCCHLRLPRTRLRASIWSAARC